MKEVVQEVVESLLLRAKKAQNCNEAMQFTQAALNAAHCKHAMEKRSL